jgi:peptidoglycan/xylan/chitin deacetylase (PgdA/CDA1 family)
MGADIQERNAILAGLPQPIYPLPNRLSREELKALAYEPLTDIGAHGWSHRALADLSIKNQREEVMQSIRMLSDVTGAAVRLFAYPFGGPVTSELASVLREAGIHAGFAIANGPITLDSDLWALPRLEVANWSEDEFESQLRSVFDE